MAAQDLTLLPPCAAPVSCLLEAYPLGKGLMAGPSWSIDIDILALILLISKGLVSIDLSLVYLGNSAPLAKFTLCDLRFSNRDLLTKPL